MSLELINALKANNIELAEKLISEGKCDFTYVDKEGENVLHYASDPKNLSVFKLLSQRRGFDQALFSISKRYLRSAADLVLSHKNLSAFEIILNQVDINLIKDQPVEKLYGGGYTLIHRLAESNDHFCLEAFDMLLNKIASIPNINMGAVLTKQTNNDKARTPLHCAASRNALTQACRLVRVGIDAAVLDKDGKTALDLACGRTKTFLETLNKNTDLSDSDSEDESDYQYKDVFDQFAGMACERIQDLVKGDQTTALAGDFGEKMQLTTDTKEPKDSMDKGKEKAPEQKPVQEQSVVFNYRGIHFYKNCCTARQRKNAIAMVKHQASFGRFGVFAESVYKDAKRKSEFPGKICSVEQLNKEFEQEEKALQERVNSVRSSIRSWQGIPQGAFSTLVSSGRVFANGMDAYIQCYVNSYSHARKVYFTGQQGLPIISTTEDEAWAFKYAVASINYDEKSGLPKSDKASIVLTPQYQRDGHPKHPYLGLVYVLAHTVGELKEPKAAEQKEQTSVYIPHLHHVGRIVTKPGPFGNEKGGYMKARERAFFANIDKRHAILTMPVRVPNFAGIYKDCYQQKYGMSKGCFYSFYRDLHHHAANAAAFTKTEFEIIKFVMQHQLNLLWQLRNVVSSKAHVHIQYATASANEFSEQRPDIETFMQKK